MLGAGVGPTLDPDHLFLRVQKPQRLQRSLSVHLGLNRNARAQTAKRLLVARAAQYSLGVTVVHAQALEQIGYGIATLEAFFLPEWPVDLRRLDLQFGQRQCLDDFARRRQRRRDIVDGHRAKGCHHAKQTEHRRGGQPVLFGGARGSR